jgi:hypothetical protein
MEFDVETNRAWQIGALMLTIVLVGGAMLYAFTAA